MSDFHLVVEPAEPVKRRPDKEQAIHALLDLVTRGAGLHGFTTPQSSETDRAILALFDSVGRNP